MSEKEKRTVYTDELNENLLHMLDGQPSKREQVEITHRNRRNMAEQTFFSYVDRYCSRCVARCWCSCLCQPSFSLLIGNNRKNRYVERTVNDSENQSYLQFFLFLRKKVWKNTYFSMWEG